MRILLLFFIGIGICGGILAQPTIQWQRTLGGSYADHARATQQTSDGGYIVAGRTLSTNGDVFNNHGGSDFWIIKLEESGDIQWKKTYGGTNNETAFSIQQTTDNGYIIAGFTLSDNGTVSENHGYYDAWVLKINQFGTVQWQKCLGGSGWEEAWSVKQTMDGGYIVAGRSNSTDGDVTENHGLLDYWVVKLDTIGEIQWQRSYGGSGYDLGYSIAQTSDGGYIVGGETESLDGQVAGNHGSSDYWILKLNFEGKIEWKKALGGTSLDETSELQQTRDGGYIVFGQARSNNGDVTGLHGAYDFWIVKLNQTGEIDWQKTLGGSGEEFARSIYQTADDGYILTGQTQSIDGDVVGNDGGADVWIVKLDKFGALEWQKSIGGTKAEVGHSIRQTNDGGYIIAGQTQSNNGDVSDNNGSDDFWIIKLNPETSPTTQATTLPLSLYPNPAQNTLQIQIPTPASSANLTLSNALGQILLNQNLSLDSFGKAQLDLSALPNGFYLLSATLPDGQVFSGKMHKLE